MTELSDGYWDICNGNFDREVSTPDEMAARRRGNCFSLSSFLATKFMAGICIEVLSSRRNYHVSNWVATTDDATVVHLDLLEDLPFRRRIASGMAGSLRQLSGLSRDAIYYSEPNAPSGESAFIRQPLDTEYRWPEEAPSREAVYLAARTGVKALRTLAAQGGTRQLLTQPQPQQLGLPALPRG